MKILRVGDPHVRPSNLEESEKLMSFVAEIALKENVNRIELMGDLFHTHAILRLEVVEFWDHWLDHLSDICETEVLVGNHDLSGDFHSSSHALSVFNRIKKKNLKIVDNARLEGVYGYMPYIHDNEKFSELARGLLAAGAKVLVCHATFNGSKFENGFFAPGGVEPIPEFTHIISGHIHAQQEFANVIYPGTARWDTASDANQHKGIWVFEHAPDGTIIKRDFYATNHVCTPILHYVWVEGTEAPEIAVGSRASVECMGSSDFIAKAKLHLKGKASIRAKITDKSKLENRKSGSNLKEFLLNFYSNTTVNKEKLLKYLEDNKLV